jgi:hypothetical protein
MAKHPKTIADLEWMETFINEVRGYIANNPISTLEDRTEIVMSAKGTPVIKIIARKEDQIKALLLMQKEALILLGEIDRLREVKDAANMELRGGREMSGIMEDNM